MRGQLIRDGITGTLNDPIMVRSAGEEQFAGCTGFPADSHNVIWLRVRTLFRTPLDAPTLC